MREKDAIKGVILASAKKTFFAGAELKDVLAAPDDAPEVFRWIEPMKKNCARWRRSACRWCGAQRRGARRRLGDRAGARTAASLLDDPKIQLGLPEVTLGLLPGAGGVTKMTRLLGLQGALPYLVEGKLLPARGAEAGPGAGLSPTPRRPARGGAGVDRGQPGAEAALGRQELQDARRRAHATRRSPQMLAVAPAMLQAEDARPLSGARRRSLAAMVEGAHGRFRHRAAHRDRATSPSSWSARSRRT